MQGIAGTLALLALGLGVALILARSRSRAISSAGYLEMEPSHADIRGLTYALFALPPREVRRQHGEDPESWLVFVDTRDTEAPDLAMLVYRVRYDQWPKVVVLRSGRRIPKFIRRLEGAMFTWAEPLPDSELTSLEETGWFAYREAGTTVPAAAIAFLASAARSSPSALYGVAVMGPYLVLWTDTWRVKSLLAAAPAVRSAFQSTVTDGGEGEAQR